MRKTSLSNVLLWIIIAGNSILRTETSSDRGNLPEQQFNRSNCINGALEEHFSPFCETGRIAVESLSFACSKTVNCSDQSLTDPVPNSTLEIAVSAMSGERQRAFRVPSVDRSSCDARHTFMLMNYYCVEASQALEICNLKTINSKTIVYIWSKGYPHGPFQETACNCSVRVNDQKGTVVTTQQLGSSSISVITIHSKLAAGQQLVMTSPSGIVLKNITEDVHNYTISYEQFSYRYMNIIWKSVRNSTDGMFWLGFQSSNSSDTVTLSCQKPSSTTLPTQSKSTKTPQSSVSPLPSRRSLINSVSANSSADSARLKDLQGTPEEDSIDLMTIIAGVLGALLLLGAIIIIAFRVKKRKKNVIVPGDTKEEANIKNHTHKENNTNKEVNTSSGVPKLPPISVSGNRIAYPEDDDISNDIPNKQEQKRKKKKRRTAKVSDQSEDGTENSTENREHSELDQKTL